MRKEEDPYILSEQDIAKLFEVRYAKFVRTDYQVIIAPSYMTHEKAAELFHLAHEDIVDGGYLEANTGIYPVLIVRDFADTVGLSAGSAVLRTGDERDNTVAMFEAVLANVKIQGTTVKIIRQ